VAVSVESIEQVFKVVGCAAQHAAMLIDSGSIRNLRQAVRQISHL